MKLSEILKTSEKYDVTPNFTGEELPEPNSRDIQFKYGYNTAITSCDREIDREALAKVIYGLKSVFKNPNHFSLKEQEKMALDDAQTLVSAMPTWLKRIKDK